MIVLLFHMQLDDHFSKPMKEFVSLCLKKNPAEVGINCVCFLQFKFCGHVCVNHEQIRKEPNPEHDFLLCISNIRLEKYLALSMILTNWPMTQLLENTEFKANSRFNLWNWKYETLWRRCLKSCRFVLSIYAYMLKMFSAIRLLVS